MKSTIGLAAMVASAMGGLGQDVEVLPRHLAEPPGLGEWLRRNNRRRETGGAFGSGRVKQQRQRLQRATGPGSYDEWKRELATKRAQVKE